MSATSSFYESHASTLSQQYNSVSFEQVHQSWKPYWPSAGDRVLDVGAGSGRDAKWLAEQGCSVIALEPCAAFRLAGEQLTGPEVIWLDDSLPGLTKVVELGMRFDLILVSAVWMHIAPTYRSRAFRKLSNLLAPNGKLVISLRHGEFEDGRSHYEVSAAEIENLAKASALHVSLMTDTEHDALDRVQVNWQTVVLNLPDDGSGDLLQIRHIIVNDSKAATYKLALLRTLLRIADAHSGAVIERIDGKVLLPAGLVALYWMRQFKRLLDKPVDDDGAGIQQNSNPHVGLGFVKSEGWGQLTALEPEHYCIGAWFADNPAKGCFEAKALQKALSDALQTIKNGPVTFIYQGDKSNRTFDILSPSRRRKSSDSVLIDMAFLSSYGTFVLDESLWDCLRLYNSWIEPLVVNQWIQEMKKYQLNQQRNISLDTYYQRLQWIDPKRDTNEVRTRIEALRHDHQIIHSVWSGQPLRHSYHVDHCLPFAYWPNNDRWNLLPTTADENLNKKDRVPTQHRFKAAKSHILAWWQLAWNTDYHRLGFFAEAAMSLPNISPQCHDFEAVFEAMGLQIRGVQSRLLVGEW